MTETLDGRCPVCDDDRHEPAYAVSGELPGRRGPWPVVQCLGCESFYLRPRPADPGSLYGEAYHVYRNPGRLTARLKRVVGFLHALGAARHAGPRGSAVFEIGCGTGETLSALSKLGYEARGIEVSLAAAKIARERGVAVDEGAFEGGRGVAGKYDLVLAAHVLEHVADPRRFLDDIRRILRPGGKALLKVPVAGSFAELVFGAHAGSFDVPYHLFVPPRSALHALMTDAGLVVEKEKAGKLPNDWIHGLRRGLRAGTGIPLPFARPWNPLFVLPLLPVSLLAAIAGGPSRVTLVLRRPV